MKSTESNHSSFSRRRGVVAVVLREDQFLVIRRSKFVTAPCAHCFPGGGVELGETESDALKREMREELGVTAYPRRRLWQSVTSGNVRLSWWLTHLEPDANLVPNPDEVEDACWLEESEILRLTSLLESNRQFFAALAKREFVLNYRV